MDTNLSDLPYFLPQMRLHFSKNRYYQLKPSDQKTFTTVEEGFAKIPRDVIFQIDVKDPKNEAAQKELIRLIRKYNRESTTIIGSETSQNTKILDTEGADIPKFYNYESALKYLLCYWVGLLPFIRFKEDAAPAAFLTRDYLRMKLEEGRDKHKYYYFVAAFVFLANLTQNAAVEHMQKRGVFTSYWVINDEDEMRKVMRDHTCQGIMTDRPSTLRKVMDQMKNEELSQQSQETVQNLKPEIA